MFEKFIKKFKGDRKYFSIVFFILILIVVSGVISESILRTVKQNWDNRLTEKISEIENTVKQDFSKKQNDILNKLNSVRNKLRNTLQPETESYKELVRIINSNEFDDYSIEIFAPNGKLIAWNQSLAINQNELFPLSFPLGETYFLSNYLLTYLAIIDTAHIQSDIFYLTVSKPIEKKYTLHNQYNGQLSFTNEISQKYANDFEIVYSPYSERTKDGRKYSFELTNNFNSKIALITFSKPTLNSEINNVKEISSKVQSLLVLLAILFVGLGLRSDFKELNSRVFKFSLLLIYLTALRSILFVVGFPSKFVDGALTDPSYFSSAFAWGIVKSPLEFLTTNILAAFLCIQFFRYSRSYLKVNTSLKSKIVRIASSIFLASLIFLLLRGLSAIVRSVIFDSTIRYFKEPNILPDLPSLVMNLNLLLAGFAFILTIIAIINIIIKLSRVLTNEVNVLKLFLVYGVVIIINLISFFISNDPLIPFIVLVIFLVLLFLLHYQIISKNINSIYNYLYILLISSIISITLLNYFNTKLERESLKTTAIEINRIDENFLNFMLEETLSSISNDNQVVYSFNNRAINFNALAFIIWSRSAMQRESLNSGIKFYDRYQNYLGGYQVGLEPDKEIFKELKQENDGPVIIETNLNNDNSIKYHHGILRIRERGIVKGFISAFVGFDIESMGAEYFPDFVQSNLSILNRVIDVKQLKIFQFKNENLSEVFGDIYPSRDQIKQILQTKIDSSYNDAWLKLKFENETYETYLLRNIKDNDEILTAVAVAEREFSWNLFNFFKIFIVHSFFIVLTFFIILLSRLNKLNFTFKGKLLFAFLFISIIPVVILALYNSKIVTERSREGIFNELSQRANYVEKQITSQLQKYKNRDLLLTCQNVNKELGISFALYFGTDQIYNSQEHYNQIGFFDRKLNSKTYYQLHYLRYKEYLTSEKINDYYFDNYYRYISINGTDYILSVNDAFNRIKTSFTTAEINVVIFGIYSFAVIIIIIISTLFANQISQPIQRLTKAAEAVGKGDLNVKIEHSERGELKELLDGFNMMTSELKKNQIEIAEMEREAAWKEMAKQVAHEIKNPLTPMKLALQQLMIAYKDKSKDFDKLFEKVSQTVLNQIDNLSGIASEFSRFAKMPSLKIEVFDLVSVLNDTVNMFLHEKTSIQINTELKVAEIEADLSQLRRMLINLIRNSIQADASKITINLKEKDGFYKLLFIDNGQGIKEEIKDKIFEANFTTKKQGMGLGLSLAKRFLESIKGEIKLLSTSEFGSTFLISIPVYQKKVI
jgi:signal transduction histidine kinase